MTTEMYKITDDPEVQVMGLSDVHKDEQYLADLEAQLPQINSDFVGKSLIVMDQLRGGDIKHVFTEASEALRLETEGDYVDNLKGKRVACLFFEDSTRTYFSYRAAAGMGGAFVDGFNSTEGMSTNKGEEDKDTVETFDQLFHLLVMRHPNAAFIPERALDTEHPVHNGGNASREHVTQALLDGFTVVQRKGTLEGQRITIYGDLLMGRTGHSFAELAVKMGASLNLVAPEKLQMPTERVRKLGELGARMYITDNIEDVIGKTDVLYRLRTQKNRFSTAEYAELRSLVPPISTELLEKAPANISLLHPRPEDSKNPDFTPDVRNHAGYDVLYQSRMGLFVRRALLGLTLDRPLL
jgi:aspartate carbamoyltransferase